MTETMHLQFNGGRVGSAFACTDLLGCRISVHWDDSADHADCSAQRDFDPQPIRPGLCMLECTRKVPRCDVLRCAIYICLLSGREEHRSTLQGW